MQISDIKKTKRGRFSIYIEDEFSGVLHGDIYLTSKIRIGEQITIEQLNELLHKSQVIIAKERALTLLSARTYTAKGLKAKLLRDVDDPAADEIIVRMQELGLIDDHDYAMRYAKDCINIKGFSHAKVADALYSRGLDRFVIEDTIAKLPPENQEKLIYEQIKKKYLKKLQDENDLRRTIDALLRRRYNYQEIKRVIDNLKENINYYEEYWEE